jgi:hypothetical protein
VLDAVNSSLLDANQPMRIYADPASSVSMSISSNGGPNPWGTKCTLAFSGYTVTP